MRRVYQTKADDLFESFFFCFKKLKKIIFFIEIETISLQQSVMKFISQNVYAITYINLVYLINYRNSKC